MLRVWLAFEYSGISGMGLSIRIRNLIFNNLLIKPFDYIIEFRILSVFDSIVKTFNYADIVNPIIKRSYIKEIEVYSVFLNL